MTTGTRAMCVSLLGALALGCGTDLGPCDEALAQEVVYGPLGMRLTAGQALTHDGCSGGGFCHARQASGPDRFGAPKGLDFDMVEDIDRGWQILMDHREQAWAEVEGGTMPPAGRGWPQDWYYDRKRDGASERLPSLGSDRGKEVFRNWLACEGPTVENIFEEAPSDAR